MRIREVSVSNFRAVAGRATLSLGDMTALIGSNGSGKTTLLLAIERFFGGGGGMDASDFSDGERPIEIEVVAEDGDGKETRVKCEWERRDKDGSTAVAALYTHSGRTAARHDEFLSARAVCVPAEHGAAGDGGDAALARLIDGAVRSRMPWAAAYDEVRRRKGFQHHFAGDLASVEALLNRKLGAAGDAGYAPDVRVRLRFGEPAAWPDVEVCTVDGETGREAGLARVGHGARRALYMAALEAAADTMGEADAEEEAVADMDGMDGMGGAATLYVIDEPELHQSPQRQGLLLAALRRLSESPSAQVIYATHSPHFVRLGERMGIHRVSRTEGGIGIRSWAGAGGDPVRGGVARAIEEAIFASGAVLVEGHHDEAILRVVLEATPHGDETLMGALARREVAVVDCRSKYNIEHYYGVLDRLGIGCFVVWDGDMNAKAKNLATARTDNKKFLAMLKEDPERAKEIEAAGAGDCLVGGNWACFGHDSPSYFAGYFGTTPKSLESKIKKGTDIGRDLDMAKFSQSEFCRTALPGIQRAMIGQPPR